MSFRLLLFHCIPFHFILSHILQSILFLSYYSFPGKGGKPATVPRTYAAAYIFLGFSRFGRPAAKMRWIFSENQGFLTIAEAPGSTGGVQCLVGTMSRVCDANELLVSPRRPGSLSVRDVRLFCELCLAPGRHIFLTSWGGSNPPQILRFRFSREQKESRSGCH